MIIFAIELSSKQGSIALVEDGKVIAEKSWIENFKNRQQLFDAMGGLGIDWDCIDCFVVGRGPGAFSGMRIGFSVVNALAAPGGKPVYALNSGAALAAQIDAERLAVVGDARRNKVWAGVFNGMTLEKEFQLLEYDDLAAFIPENILVVSPDHDRLEDFLSDYQIMDEAAPVFPTAGALGQLVSKRLDNDIESEPFEPLYMHPPVFIKPRFSS